MKERLALSTILFLLCAAASTTSQSRKQSAGGTNDISAKAVWHPPQAVWGKMQDACSSGGVECVASFMRQAGAPRQAIAFTMLLSGEGSGEGYLDSFREMGKVDVATVFDPFRANDNGTILLVNGTPRLINLENLEKWGHIDITRDPLYPSLARQFPQIELWGNPRGFTMQRLPPRGQRFVIQYVLLNGCHACEVAGYAHVAFDFDGLGAFMGIKLLRLSRS